MPPSPSRSTKARVWADARREGRRLPEHEIAHCDLCGDPMNADPEVFATTGLDICPDCLEGFLDASTDEPRAEVGLVGGCH